MNTAIESPAESVVNRNALRAAVAPAVAESVIPIDARTLGVLKDNNYPFSSGRNPGQPDDNEFIL